MTKIHKTKPSATKNWPYNHVCEGRPWEPSTAQQGGTRPFGWRCSTGPFIRALAPGAFSQTFCNASSWFSSARPNLNAFHRPTLCLLLAIMIRRPYAFPGWLHAFSTLFPPFWMLLWFQFPKCCRLCLWCQDAQKKDSFRLRCVFSCPCQQSDCCPITAPMNRTMLRQCKARLRPTQPEYALIRLLICHETFAHLIPLPLPCLTRTYWVVLSIHPFSFSWCFFQSSNLIVHKHF